MDSSDHRAVTEVKLVVTRPFYLSIFISLKDHIIVMHNLLRSLVKKVNIKLDFVAIFGCKSKIVKIKHKISEVKKSKFWLCISKF